MVAVPQNAGSLVGAHHWNRFPSKATKDRRALLVCERPWSELQGFFRARPPSAGLTHHQKVASILKTLTSGRSVGALRMSTSWFSELMPKPSGGVAAGG